LRLPTPLRSPERLVLGAALLWSAPLCAQQTREFGVQTIGTASTPVLAVGALYGALRTSNRTRLSITAGPGGSGGDVVFRAELLGHFLLSPNKLKGAGPYFAAGIAGVGGPVDRGYMVLTLGFEQGPGARAGWVAEAGVGGGFRVALGYRWRKHRSARLP
jgi:hypothetical protein